MKHNILDIKGLKVGQAQNTEAKTGVTVVIAEKGAVCGVDVRGAAPGTRETDLLNPINAMEKVQAIVLSGGSAFGLEAASGVMDYLEEKGIGFDVGVTKVPIVPSAVLFDLGYGDAFVRPDKAMGRAGRRLRCRLRRNGGETERHGTLLQQRHRLLGRNHRKRHHRCRSHCGERFWGCLGKWENHCRHQKS